MSLSDKLLEERRRRLETERLLELKQAQLATSHRNLDHRAQELARQLVSSRAEVETVLDENQRVRSDLDAAKEKIALVERRLWQSIETVRDGFAFYDSDLKLIMANHAFLVIFDGMEDVKSGANYMTILQALTDEGIVNVGDMTPKAWRQKMMDRIILPQPPPVILQLWNGNHIRMTDRRNVDGNLVTIGTDITTSVEKEAALRQATAMAEKANRAKSTFLAHMSHEIRTPMNGVVGMADMLSETELDDDQRLFVDTIRSSAEALLVIVNDVLDYSKIEANRLELIERPFDPEKAVQDVILLLRPSAQEKGLELILDYDLFLPQELVGDVGRIRQVLTNFMSNAIKFTECGQVLVKVMGEIDELTGETTLCIAVEDTGIGISKSEVDRIFGAYNQVENTRNLEFDGTGLGLSISQKLIELMGGHITVESQPGVGSQFSFRIPVGVQRDQTETVPNLPDGLRRVLVVDQPGTNRSVLSRQLERLGLGVLECADQNKAFDMTGPGIDLVIADQDILRGSGLEYAQAVRRSGNLVPILMLCADPEKMERHPDGGDLTAILPKPLARNTLIQSLEALGPILEAAQAQAGRMGLRKMKVLAADDNKTNRLVFAQMLKTLPLDLIYAQNGKEAVQAYEQQQIDLVFMDISMPVMDGLEATAAIRQIETGTDRRVPIIALTANVLANDTKSVFEAGLDDYLTKPMRQSALVQLLRAYQPKDTLPLDAEDQPEVG